ncbi:CAP domain-containing protein [Alteromonas sp. CYL-A6]|uniref:CAP domain-containing protein n=1 Tax=Alteromonas nitratireducens TaxID=3390813 RepID=UPI0034C24359
MFGYRCITALPLRRIGRFSVLPGVLAALFSFNTYADPSTSTRWQYCGNNAEARELAKLIITDLQQQRAQIHCHPVLTRAAAEKAVVMAKHELVAHFLGGSPNSRLREAGLSLPDYYGSAMSNQVEAIAGGYKSAGQVWNAFKKSHDHRQHLLGEIDFYREQNQLGIGFYKDPASPYVEHWVVYLTKLKKDSDHTNFDTIPDKGLGVMTPRSEVKDSASDNLEQERQQQ